MSKILIDAATITMALEALEGIHPGNMTPMAEEYWNKAITALKALAEQPAQRKPLTDEQWQSIADTLDCIITRGQKDTIEAALRIKENT